VIDEAMIEEAGRRLSEAAPAGTRVILFGSHARGEAGRHSDLDFLVIEPEVGDAANESVRLRRTLRGLLLAADVIVVSEQKSASGATFAAASPDPGRHGQSLPLGQKRMAPRCAPNCRVRARNAGRSWLSHIACLARSSYHSGPREYVSVA
jgi:predicted nucleotidyltransferase